MLWGCEHTVLPLNSLPLNPYPSVSGSLLAVGLPNVLKFSGVETSANGLWSPNGLYLFMQALASPQDSVALTQEDSRALKKKWPFIRVTQHFRPMRRQMVTSAGHYSWWCKCAPLQIHIFLPLPVPSLVRPVACVDVLISTLLDKETALHRYCQNKRKKRKSHWQLLVIWWMWCLRAAGTEEGRHWFLILDCICLLLRETYC